MGGSCSVDKKGISSHVEKSNLSPENHAMPTGESQSQPMPNSVRGPNRTGTTGAAMQVLRDQDPDQYHMVDALDAALSAGAGPVRRGDGRGTERTSRHVVEPTVLEATGFGAGTDSAASREAEFFRQRRELIAREDALAFDHRCRQEATDLQNLADKVLQAVKQADIETVYNAAEKRSGYGGQKHARFFGDHFLSNVDLIDQTRLFAVAQRMPKGAHLHIHFNANLTPDVLINIAKEMPCMYISSDVSLAPRDDADTCFGGFDTFEMCRLQFHLLADTKAATGLWPPYQVPSTEEDGALWLGNIFSYEYPTRDEVACRPRMKFDKFRTEFAKHYPHKNVDEWLQSKLAFSEVEAHNHIQTAQGAWEKFNSRTQMMKGLFNYVRAYEEYTRRCLEDFVADNIQYAEIRPNFMKANQLWSNDGTEQIDNRGIMNIIMRVCKEFCAQNGDFGGMKIIYCTPRSSSKEDVADALRECLQFKLEWPEWIAGFDLLGEESEGNPLSHFAAELLNFKQMCQEAQVDIPFLFHCAETLEVGGTTDGNLLDALLLGAKRIGHGFALDRHPYVLEHMKKNNTCVELCPISNEILGLTPRVSGHSMYNLLARNVHCTVSTDNGTLFRSRLSHDFYQLFAGSQKMSLHGWRQLIEWSFDHSCMEPDLNERVRKAWEQKWIDFCQWIVDTYYQEYLESLAQSATARPAKILHDPVY